MSRTITDAQILGLTGDEPPLTPQDLRIAVEYAFRGWRGEWLLAGRPDARAGDWGCAGWPTEHYSVNVTTRTHGGLLIRVSERPEGRTCTIRPRPAPAAVRVGRITWRAAEAILRQIHTPDDDGALFSLEAL
jgi:hypothetical protein